MKNPILFSLLILFIVSCSDKENGYIYPGMIHAGQSSGVGIRYVDVEPNELIVKKDNHYGDTTKVLDLNNDGIADFELTHYAFASMQSQHDESLKITALGQNSVCTVPTENN
ncbi:MAG: hypothetical protein IPH88_02065 [Bacteroidales bacterium]|nr:hypothetical protein [Bacteroidales bacterium]